ncbi:SWIM zinc finger family protein [Candidatus Poribacteria bacterium]|nr:SWIM zinc finger family protein [Candidatus Poribacteria bacterium]
MGRWNNDFYSYFPKSHPREAKGGIKAQSRGRGFGKSWWAKRWISVLESFNIGARLGRGRSYARRGQVLSIDISKGVVKAKVQGSMRTPYKVEISIEPLSKSQWKKLAEAFGKQAIFAAKLLSGQMPENIEEAFTETGVSLFPARLNDLSTDCSCPDWSNPCKHIAAVYYLLGEEFDRDPFLIFKLRGMDREEIIELVGKTATPKARIPGEQSVEQARTEIESDSEQLVAAEPLPAEPNSFWGVAIANDALLGEVHIPPVPAALPRRLGNFPFWRGRENFMEALEQVYANASATGMDAFLGTLSKWEERPLLPPETAEAQAKEYKKQAK